MNFYFNYFSFIGGEGILIVSVSVSLLHIVFFLKKLTSRRNLLTLSWESWLFLLRVVLKKCLPRASRSGRGVVLWCVSLAKTKCVFMLQNIPKNIVVAGRIVRQKVMASLARCKQDTTHCIWWPTTLRRLSPFVEICLRVRCCDFFYYLCATKRINKWFFNFKKTYEEF